MPAEGPGERYSVVATKAVAHGAPAVENRHPGIAAKSAQAQPAAVSVANALAAQQIAVGEEMVIMLTGLHDFPSSFLPVAAAVGDPLWIRTADNSLTNQAGALATLLTGVVASNNAIRWTSRDARVPRVQLVDPAGASVALSVDVDGLDIIVTLATNGSSVITSTATQVMAAVNEHDAASGLVTVASEGASTGAGVVAPVAITALTVGGTAVVKFGRISAIDSTLAMTSVNLNLRGTF
jgi:hypothetical protein